METDPAAGPAEGAPAASPKRRSLRLDPARLRFWAIVLPIHGAAFAALYVGTQNLLVYAYSHAAAASARSQLDQAVREMPFLMPAAAAGNSTHVFAHLLALHEPIGLRLYDGGGGVIGPVVPPPDEDETLRVKRLLATRDQMNEVWVQRDGKRQWVRGVVRLGVGNACLPCHSANTTLGAATMRIDFTEELGGIKRLLRWRVGLLLALWIVLVAAIAVLVQLTLRRSLARLEKDMDAAASGGDDGQATAALPFDPATARLYERLRDLLRRQRAREAEVASRLAHVDQLATLGQLSASLAHEIKNPLAGLQGALEVLKSETADSSTATLYDEMLGELARVNGILRRLLESGRPAPVRLALTDLSRLIGETIELLEPALRRKHVDLKSDVAAELPQVRLDSAKMRQVLVNLIQNAGEAMGERGGRVTVRASALPQKDGVVLAVEDDGPGIPAAELARLFEPFFTTKFTGTGLGLTISKSLVEQHGGHMEVDSEPGRGTTFFVFLPSPAAGGAEETEVA